MKATRYNLFKKSPLVNLSNLHSYIYLSKLLTDRRVRNTGWVLQRIIIFNLIFFLQRHSKGMQWKLHSPCNDSILSYTNIAWFLFKLMLVLHIISVHLSTTRIKSKLIKNCWNVLKKMVDGTEGTSFVIHYVWKCLF